MGEVGKAIVFVGTVFILLICIIFLSIGVSDNSVLEIYKPYQSVRPITIYDTESYYDDFLDMYRDRPITKPYMLVTASSEVGYSYSEPNFKVIDYGTYHEIDSLKCVRYKQMQWKMYHLDKLNEKICK